MIARDAGFTLLELIVVVAILSIILGMAVPSVIAIEDGEKARAALALLDAHATAIEAFGEDMRRTPQSLGELVTNTTGSNRWKGPYLDVPAGAAAASLDPWGVALTMSSVDQKTVRLHCAGPDGVFSAGGGGGNNGSGNGNGNNGNGNSGGGGNNRNGRGNNGNGGGNGGGGNGNSGDDVVRDVSIAQGLRAATKFTVDRVNAAIVAYNGVFLATQPLSGNVDAVVNTLRARSLLPNGYDWTTDGFGVKLSTSASPVTFVFSTSGS